MLRPYGRNRRGEMRRSALHRWLNGAQHAVPLRVQPTRGDEAQCAAQVVEWGTACCAPTTTWAREREGSAVTDTVRKHNRRSVRMKGYDYSQPGEYFVTICSAECREVFGSIVGGEVRLNSWGRAVQSCWEAIPSHFPRVELDEYAVMPDHLHGLIAIVGEADTGGGACCDVGGSPRVRPEITACSEGGELPRIQSRGTACSEGGELPRIQPGGTACCEGGELPRIQSRGTACSEGGELPRIQPGGTACCEGGELPRIQSRGTACCAPTGGVRRFGEMTPGSLPAIVRSFKGAVTRLIREAEDAAKLRVWQRGYYEHVVRNEEEHYLIGQYIVNNPVTWQRETDEAITMAQRRRAFRRERWSGEWRSA